MRTVALLALVLAALAVGAHGARAQRAWPRAAFAPVTASDAPLAPSVAALAVVSDADEPRRTISPVGAAALGAVVGAAAFGLETYLYCRRDPPCDDVGVMLYRLAVGAGIGAAFGVTVRFVVVRNRAERAPVARARVEQRDRRAWPRAVALPSRH